MIIKCVSRQAVSLIAAMVLSNSPAGAAQSHTVQPIKSIVPDFIGEFRAIAGHVTQYISPPEPRAPHAFIMKDQAGDSMRIVIWPDIFERIDNHEALKSTGTSVTLTAEVVEYNEKIEMHVGDWEEIDVEGTPPAPAAPAEAVTSGTVPTTPADSITTVVQTTTTTLENGAVTSVSQATSSISAAH